jgi:hypothetical protein
VPFPSDGPANGIVRASATDFILPTIGTYDISWQVSVSDETGQLVLALDTGGGPILQLPTLAGRSVGEAQIVNRVFLTTSVAGVRLSVRNPPLASPMTITPNAGGNVPSSSWLTITRLS